MNAAELALIKQVTELVADIAQMKGKMEVLEKENEFLRGLLKDKLDKKD